MQQPLIQFCDVDFSYSPARPVLCGADFSLFPDEKVALSGSNGTGKTTFLHLLVGLLKVDRGVITAFGKERRSEEDFYEVRTRAGLVFQDSDDQLFCPTVLEDVAFGPLNLGKSPQEARDISRTILQGLGLGDFEERITHKLSYGEKRLIALATVLAMEPDVLLLDEPTNGLDDAAQQRLKDVLSGLPQAMILISHDAEFRLEVSTRSVQLAGDGRLHSC